MSKRLLTRAGLCLTVWASIAAPCWAVEPGQNVSDLEVHGSTAATRLADLKGRWVYLDFWASWCGPCRASFPWMGEMQKKYGPRGLQVLAVNLDAKRADADRFLAEVPAAFALAFDPQGQSAQKIGVKGMPTSVLIGPDGRVVSVHQGFRPQDRAALEAKIAAALSASGAKAP